MLFNCWMLDGLKKGNNNLTNVLKRNMADWFRVAKLHLNKVQHFWSDETKVEMFVNDAHNHIGRKPNTAYLHKHLIPAVSTLVGDDLGLFCSDGTWTPRGH